MPAIIFDLTGRVDASRAAAGHIGLLMTSPALMRRVPWVDDGRRRPYERCRDALLDADGRPVAPDPAGFFCNAVVQLPRRNRGSWARQLEALDGQLATVKCMLRYYDITSAAGWRLELRSIVGEDLFAD